MAEHGELWSIRKATVYLLSATALIAWMSEILVGTVEHASHVMGMNQVFIGVVVVAIVGNAAEHSTAVLVALKNEMDLAVGIAIGSALQIALFVAPILVFASYLRGEPMDLRFTSFEVVSVLVAVFIARMVAEDGESNWIEGLMLLMVYAILALAFFFLPERSNGDHQQKLPEAHAMAPMSPNADGFARNPFALTVRSCEPPNLVTLLSAWPEGGGGALRGLGLGDGDRQADLVGGVVRHDGVAVGRREIGRDQERLAAGLLASPSQ
jgi:hypothetical protein